MLLNYEAEIQHITKGFEEKIYKKLKVDSLIKLSVKLIDLQDNDIVNSMLELKKILRNIAESKQKQKRIYRKEFENLKKMVVDEFGFHQKGSIVEKFTSLGLVFGIAVGAALSSFLSSAAVLGLVLGMTIGAAIGTKKEKEEADAGNIY